MSDSLATDMMISVSFAQATERIVSDSAAGLYSTSRVLLCGITVDAVSQEGRSSCSVGVFVIRRWTICVEPTDYRSGHFVSAKFRTSRRYCSGPRGYRNVLLLIAWNLHVPAR